MEKIPKVDDGDDSHDEFSANTKKDLNKAAKKKDYGEMQN